MENLVGYAKEDLMVPLELDEDTWAAGPAGLNERAVSWCQEVNRGRHSEICAIPADRHHRRQHARPATSPLPHRHHRR